jgi:hypothetical protein
VARGGLADVEALAEAGRWDDAALRAGELTEIFRAARPHLHAVAGEAFDGLLAAARARDRDELGDFAELVRELFP